MFKNIVFSNVIYIIVIMDQTADIKQNNYNSNTITTSIDNNIKYCKICGKQLINKQKHPKQQNNDDVKNKIIDIKTISH